jgi:hypothetical protein
VAFLNTFLAIEKSIFRLKRQENIKKEEREKGKRRPEERRLEIEFYTPLPVGISPEKGERYEETDLIELKQGQEE